MNGYLKKRRQGWLAVVFLIVGTLVLGSWGGTRFVKSILFDRGCEGHLKRAADANIMKLSEKELMTALTYAEDNNLTGDYTSVIYQTPDEDIGFWYTNLTQSMADLKSTPPTATQLERSNVLMKLRETILDDTSDGVEVTLPSGISVFPLNGLYAVWAAIGTCLLAVGGVFAFKWGN